MSAVEQHRARTRRRSRTVGRRAACVLFFFCVGGCGFRDESREVLECRIVIGKESFVIKVNNKCKVQAVFWMIVKCEVFRGLNVDCFSCPVF